MSFLEFKKMPLPVQTLDRAKRLLGFDYGKDFYHVLGFDFGEDGGAIGIWKEGDDFCARISLDSIAEFAIAAKQERDYPTPTCEIQPPRPWPRR